MISTEFKEEATKESLVNGETRRSIDPYLLIGDWDGAINLARQAAKASPNNQEADKQLIRALAAAGKEPELLRRWRSYEENYGPETEDRELLEAVAWCILKQGAQEPYLFPKLTALLGAAMTNDAYGVEVVEKMLRNSNVILRGAATQMVPMLRDQKLRLQLARMLKEEGRPEVKAQAIQSMGRIQMEEMIVPLQEIIADEYSIAEVRLAATEAVVAMSEGVSPELLSQLVDSNRFGLRLLGCELAAQSTDTSLIPELLRLADDSHGEVRWRAYRALALLGVRREEVFGIGGQDPDIEVATAAAWGLCLANPEKGHALFERLLEEADAPSKQRVAAALAATGSQGLPLLQKWVEQNEDSPMLLANLAIGSIRQRNNLERSGDALFSIIESYPKKLMWKQEGPLDFKRLAESDVSTHLFISNYPEVVHQITSLEILGTLAMIDHPDAEKAMIGFLKKKTWGVGGMAAALLLSEGDSNAIEFIRSALYDENERVRRQAALILAVWGRDPEALGVLQEAYDKARRMEKIQILEAVGMIGQSQAQQQSIPFLVSKLKEPSQVLRVIAAASLITHLNG